MSTDAENRLPRAPAQRLDPAEYSKVRRFGLHRRQIWDDVDGIRRGFVILALAAVVLLGCAALLAWGAAALIKAVMIP